MSSYLIHPNIEQEKLLLAFMEEHEIFYDKEEEQELPAHALEGIAKGREDIAAGRVFTLDEFKQKLFINRTDRTD